MECVFLVTLRILELVICCWADWILSCDAWCRCREFPSVIELMSYVFCFHGLMCGPFCFYKDYIAFIDGSNYSGCAVTVTGNGISNCHRGDSSSSMISRRVSSHGVVTVSSDGSQNNFHCCLATPPAPGVLQLFHTGFKYFATNSKFSHAAAAAAAAAAVVQSNSCCCGCWVMTSCSTTMS